MDLIAKEVRHKSDSNKVYKVLKEICKTEEICTKLAGKSTDARDRVADRSATAISVAGIGAIGGDGEPWGRGTGCVGAGPRRMRSQSAHPMTTGACQSY